MDIAIVGTGAVAHHMAAALASGGHRLVSIWGRNRERAIGMREWLIRETRGEGNDTSSSTLCDCRILTSSESLKDIKADVTLICVRDAAIEEMVLGLSNKAGIIAHTSGATPIFTDAISERNKSLDAHEFGVFYPLYSFSLNRRVYFQNVPLLIQGSTPNAESQLITLAKSLSPYDVQRTTDTQRAYYHLLGVWVNNFTNHLLLQSEGFAQRHDANWQLLQPIAEETVRKAFELGPLTAQTGPAVRNDQNTLERHRAMLRANAEDASLLSLYNQLSESIQSLTKRENESM